MKRNEEFAKIDEEIEEQLQEAKMDEQKIIEALSGGDDFEKDDEFKTALQEKLAANQEIVDEMERKRREEESQRMHHERLQRKK